MRKGKGAHQSLCVINETLYYLSMDGVMAWDARGFVGVARQLLGPMATNPQFAEEISRGIKEMLLDTEDLKVTRGMEGKEAKFMAALYGMNTGEKK